MGKKSQALHDLDSSLAYRFNLPHVYVAHLYRKDPFLKNVRDDEHFKALFEKVLEHERFISEAFREALHLDKASRELEERLR